MSEKRVFQCVKGNYYWKIACLSVIITSRVAMATVLSPIKQIKI